MGMQAANLQNLPENYVMKVSPNHVFVVSQSKTLIFATTLTVLYDPIYSSIPSNILFINMAMWLIDFWGGRDLSRSYMATDLIRR